MSQPIKHIPKLRFPEFKAKWKTLNLGDYFTFKNGINADKESYGSGRKFINVMDIVSDQPLTYNSIIGRVEVEDTVFEKNAVLYGDILFQRSSETREEVGQSNVYLDKSQPATFGGFVIRGRPIKEQEPLYMHYLLKTASVRKDLTAKSGGSTRYNVGQESLSAVKIQISGDLLEQEKIASFLNSVDEKIQLLLRKKNGLIKYKKCMMQQIFSRETCFKDNKGHNFPDWEKRQLDHFFIERVERSNAEMELLSVTRAQGVIKSSQLARSSTASSDTSNYKKVCVGDIAYNSMRMWQGTSGSSDLNGIVSPAYTVIIPNSKQVSKFWAHYFKLETLVHLFQRRSQGLTSDTWNLKYPAFSKIKVAAPTPSEQEKISKFLNTLDCKVDLVSQELAQAKAFKTHLLQQMFV